ncbi:MAG: DUF115 domain-containing protein [Spirochaetes bacterium]|nr:DUF115 domain-containing protein [Spirochaetota bacterium]
MASGEIQGKHARYRFGYEEGRFSIFADTEKLKDFPLVSRRDSVREAERHLGAFRLKPGMLALVAGVAHLPLLELLAEQLASKEGKGGLIVVFETDTELYWALKKLRPDIFTEIAVIVPENIDILAEFVERLDVEHFVGYRTFENKASTEINPSFYTDAINDFKKKIASRFSDLFTRLEFEERWVFNSLTKLAAMPRMRPVSALFDLGRGATCVIVSTGPSLRESLAELKHAEKKYFIACADSAYRVLVRAGITPHLVFSLDSQAHTTKHFALLPRGKVNMYPLLVCDAVSNPTVARDWQGEMALSFTAQYTLTPGTSPGGRGEQEARRVSPGCDYLESENFFAGAHGIIPGDLQSGGSVATSIFDLVRLMNFDKIILVGQDLAYTHREIHTPGTHHTDEWLAKTTNRLQPLENINERVLRRRHTKRETSLTGRPIVTDYILSLYRDWFVAAIERLPEKAIYNATRDGLQIAGAKILPHLDTAGSIQNSEILTRFLAAPPIKTYSEKMHALRSRVDAALQKNAAEGALSFLQYIGRKFAIKALRSPEHGERLGRKQKIRQMNFLRKLRSKL